MLHIHFGAGRLGLGLIVPFFQTTRSESFVLNRAVSGTKPTGSTALLPRRRNELLAGHEDPIYVIQEPGGRNPKRHVVHYEGFYEYGDDDIDNVIASIVHASRQCRDGVVVTASLITAANYGPVLQALELLAGMRSRNSIGPIFLVACENTLSAHEVFQDPDLCNWIPTGLHRHVTCVHALVDRVCVGLEEGQEGDRSVVVVRAEEYGSLKLELTPESEPLRSKLQGSGVEFTRHVAVEKQIKNWLLNGSHWLVALAAFQESKGDHRMKLNEFLQANPERLRSAEAVMEEMREGVAVILRRAPQYAAFVRDVDPDQYLEGAARAILDRFLSNEDPITRILARFQAPTPEAPATIQAFSKRLTDRVDEPISAYAEAKGFPPLAATRSVHSLVRLIASGTYIRAA